MFIGAFAVAILLMASSRVVWRIEVSGNEKLSDKEIIADLEEIGFGEGSYIRKTDFSELSTALRLKHSEIAHADIYCVGTVAQVRIREADVPSKEEQDPSLAHLIASRDAVIESFDVQHGTVVSEVGRVVKKGEMLVSGIVAGAHGDLLLHAEGAVYGRVTEQIVVEIPYQQEIETVKGYEKGKITLFFFGKAINIQKNGGNLPVTYGTIVERENWTLPNGCTLPISLVEEKIVLLESQSVTLSHTDALRLASAELKGKITSKLENGRLVSKHTVAEATEDGCILKCTLTYITCISETKTVDVIQ